MSLLCRASPLLLAVLVCAPRAHAAPQLSGAEAAAFDLANRTLAEQSHSRACDQFTAFVKTHPVSVLAREAKVKRARACIGAGREWQRSVTELQAIADSKIDDLPRALANLTLAERGNGWTRAHPEGRLGLAIDQLERLARSEEGRWKAEARSLFFPTALQQLAQREWDRPRAEALCKRILALAPGANDAAQARLIRARIFIRHAGEEPRGEAELVELGSGKSDVADDALHELGGLHERRQQFAKALEAYEQVVARFSGTTSNVRESARAQAENIRRPALSTQLSYFELPGQQPELAVSFRNVSEVSLALHRVDPHRGDAEDVFGKDGPRSVGAVAATVKRWSVKLTEPSRHAPGALTVPLEVPGPGAYVLEAKAGGLEAWSWTLVTPHAAVLKASREQLALFVADATSGAAVRGAKVTFFVHYADGSGRYGRQGAETDEHGVARVQLAERRPISAVVAWAESDGAMAYARTHGFGAWDTHKEYLAYALTDRPLYKPGETVGVKVFLRSRAEGPSTPVHGQLVEIRVYDPQSREVKKLELATSTFGTASFELPLARDASLGQYRVQLRAGATSLRQAQGGFRVEEFKPPEFSVNVEPVGAPVPGQRVKVRVTASRYSGGPVANAQGRAVVTERGYHHVWSRWEDDVQVGWDAWYGDDGEEHDGYRRRHRGDRWQPVFKQHTLQFKTAADGSAELELPASTEPGDRSYQVQVFVIDATRREVSGSGTVNASATPLFVDLRSDRYLYKPGEPIKLKLRAEDANGRPASPSLEARLLRLDGDGRSSVVLRRQVALADGRGEVALDGDAVGAVRIELRRAGATDEEPALAATDAWLTSDVTPLIPPQAGLSLYTDRAPLRVGGVVRALVVTPGSGGHAFLTVEGQSLLHAEGLPMNGRARFVELRLSPQMTPNVWLKVGRFEQQRFHERQAVVKVAGSDTQLQVQVRHQRELLEPGEPQRAKVEVKGGDGFSGEVEVALTSVDEALLAIEPMRRDFLSWFGRRPQQLRVTTGYTQQERSFRPRAQPPAQQAAVPDEAPVALEHVRERRNESISVIRGSAADEGQLGKMLGAPAPAKKAAREDAAPEASGGQDAARVQAPKVRSNFSSSAGWFARLAGSHGVETALAVPDSLTRFKTVALVVSRGPHLGVGEQSFRTEKPLMVRLQAPRFFTERDEVTLSALVSNRLPQAVAAQVSFSAPGLKPLDRTQRTVDVPAGGEVRVDAPFLVVEPGTVKVQVSARGGGKGDAMALELPVNVHGAAQRRAFTGRLSEVTSVKVTLPERRNASATRFELTLSPSLVSVMMDALPYLAEYPYGCVEQTLSRFVPAVVAARAAAQLGLPKSRLPRELDAMVRAGLERLYGFQHGDGGWGWWQHDGTNRWMSAYVVYGLSLAREAGVSVRPDVLERGRGYLTSHLGAALGNPEEHAFMVFALAHTGPVPKAALDTAFARRGRLSKRGKAMLAMALNRLHDGRVRIAVENLDDVFKAAQERAETSVGDASDGWSTSEAIEATAYALMAVSAYDPNSPHVKPLTDFLVLRRNGGRWRTTRDTAFAVYALSTLAVRERGSWQRGAFVVEVNGQEVRRVKYSEGGMDLLEPLVLGDRAFRPGENTVTLRRDGAGTGYFSAMFDVYNRDEDVKAVGGDVKVTRRYTLLGRPSAAAERVSASAEYGMPVESGVRVRVDLEVKATKAMQYVMIEDLKAAGFEAVAQKSGPELCNHQCAHAELRPDRVAFFLTELRAGVTRLSYELRAEVPGRFHALPARVEAMYAPELRATSDEMRLEVRDAPEPSEQGVAADLQ